MNDIELLGNLREYKTSKDSKKEEETIQSEAIHCREEVVDSDQLIIDLMNIFQRN